MSTCKSANGCSPATNTAGPTLRIYSSCLLYETRAQNGQAKMANRIVDQPGVVMMLNSIHPQAQMSFAALECTSSGYARYCEGLTWTFSFSIRCRIEFI